MMKTPRSIIDLFITACLLAGCVSPRALLVDLNRLQAKCQYDEAAGLVEKSKMSHYGKKNAFLYYLDQGMLLHYAGKYSQSNEAFENAKRLSQELFTKSVTTEASTFLVSDNMRPYYGEDFERALIHVFSALNYTFLNKNDDALVEARQVDFLLKWLQTDHGHRNVYTEDAFARLLAGMIYENQGETNDAYISYWKALEAYDVYKRHYKLKAPSLLVQYALKTANRLGFQDQVIDIQKQWGGKIPRRLPKNAGEVIVLHYCGLPPHKVDSFFEIGFGAGWSYARAVKPKGKEQEEVEKASAIARSILAEEVVRMAFPKYEKTPYKIKRMTVQAEGARKAHSSRLVENIGSIAEKNLEDRIGRIRAKTIARAVIKFALSQKIASKVEKKKGKGAAWLTKKLLQAVSSATELADKRFWQTVPDRIFMTRLVLPAGTHTLHLTFKDSKGAVVSNRDLEDITVKSGKKTFVTVRTAE